MDLYLVSVGWHTMAIHRKTFPKGTDPKYIQNEVELQKEAARWGLSPKVLKTDNKTFIEMEDLECMNIGDTYGENLEDIPQNIRSQMWSILWYMHTVLGIDYVDVWPRNFIEVENRVWIIDFGDATWHDYDEDEPNWYLEEILDAGYITQWNPDFE